jgi:protein involved in polysaccharide export with SLBB domain
VARPGPIQIPATSRVSEAVTRDVVLEGASRRNVQVRRRDGTEDIADIELFERTGNRTLNPLLENDDIIIVPAATEFVQIYGAVARPGRWEKGPEDSLHTLIRLAGGPLPSALVDRCLLVRWRTPTESDSVFFNLEDSYSGALAPRLQDGDRVYIYFTSLFHEMQQAAIYGEVLRPGSYPRGSPIPTGSRCGSRSCSDRMTRRCWSGCDARLCTTASPRSGWTRTGVRSPAGEMPHSAD